MSRKVMYLAAAVLGMAGLFANTANAAPTFFDDFTDFQNTAIAESIPLTVEDLDSTATTGQVASITTNDHQIEITPETPTTVQIFDSGGGNNALRWILADPNRSLNFMLTMPANVNAFGIFYLAATGDDMVIAASGDDDTFTTNLNGGFLGVIDPDATFSLVDLEFEGDSNLEFDGIHFGVQSTGGPVPEPTSMALFGLTALGMVIGARRRRKGRAAAEGASH